MASLKLFAVFLLVLATLSPNKAAQVIDEDKLKDKILDKLTKNLPVLVMNELMDLLKYHKYDEMLSKGHISQVEKLQREFHQMKTRINHVTRRLRHVEDENRLLKMENRKLDQEMYTVNQQINFFQANMSTTVRSMCSCKSSVGTNEPPTNTSRSVSNVSSIVAVRSDDPTFRRINLKNKNTVTLVKKSGTIKATSYDPKSRSIIWSVEDIWGDTNGIFTTSMNSLDKTNKINDATASSMDVDSVHNWLFFTTVVPRKSISRIRPTGEDYYMVHNMDKFSPLRDMRVDPSRRQIYTCDGDYLIQADYLGNQQKKLVEGGFIVTVTLGPGHKELYYYSYNQLKKRNLRSGKEVVVNTKLDTVPKTLIYHKAKLYYSDFFKGGIKALDLKSSAISELRSFDGASLSMCLIP